MEKIIDNDEEAQKKFGYYYTYLSDLESIRDRENRSVLKIKSVYPEQFLSKNIAHPDEVKHLTIITDFNTSDIGGYIYNTWYFRGKDTLCSDLVNFHNLETLTAIDLNLSEDLWIEFAQNSKNLKEINFSSSCAKDYMDNFYFFEREKAIEAMFQIPTLEKVTIDQLFFLYFPSGPSNIKYLELHVSGGDESDIDVLDSTDIEQIKSYLNNFHTHTNIKTLILDILDGMPYKLKDLKLDKMIQLEDLKIRNYWKIEDLNIESILSLPNLKKLFFSVEIDENDSLGTLIQNADLMFPNIEELTIRIWINNAKCNIDEMKTYLTELFEKRCPNLKKFELI
jgi:hypothetical protein